MLGFLGVLVSHIKEHMVLAALLHLAIDGTCHNVARSEREAWVILVHEFLAGKVTQHTAIATHGLGNQECRAVARVIEGGWVELDELHVLHGALSTIDHGNAVACGDERIGSGVIHSSHTACCDEGQSREEGIDLSCLLIENVSTIALNVGGATGNDSSQVVLCENLDSEMIVKDIDVLMSLYCLDKRLLNLVTSVVGMVKDAELAMSALTVQVKVALLVFIEVYAPVYESINLLGSLSHHLLHGLGVAEPVTCNHSVVDVLLKIVNFEVCDTCHTTLSKVGVSLVERAFAHEGNFTSTGNFQGKTHACYTRPYNEIVIFVSHIVMFLNDLRVN